MMLTLDGLLTSVPLVHGGRSCTWSIHPDLAQFLDQTLSGGESTLETGAGLSTLVVLRKGVASHIAIAPDPDEFAVIREFCQKQGISLLPLKSVPRPSQDYLPTADLPPLDLVLIDGDHSFPAPFIDWYYTADRLKVGGLMIVDDIHIATGTILADFMSVDLKWREVWRHGSGRFAVYRKQAHPINDFSWWTQPYLTATYPTRRVRLLKHRTLPRFRPALARAAYWVYPRLPAPVRRVLRSAKHRWLDDTPRASS